MSPYRSGLATGVGVVLLAGLVVALADLVHAHGGGLALLGCWSLVVLPLALGAGNVTWGPGWIRGMLRRLREDDARDRTIAALLIAAAALGGVLALAISKLAIGLVAEVQRKNVGALLLGIVVVVLVPVLAV